MAHMAVDALRHQRPLCFVDKSPAPLNHQNATPKEEVTHQHNDPPDYRRTTSQSHQQVAVLVGERVQHRVGAAQQGGERVDSQGDAIHLGKEGNDPGGEQSHRAPFPAPGR